MRPHHLTVLAALAILCVAGSADEHVVHQKGRAFSPDVMTVTRGEAVMFRNDDTVPHNVMSTTTGNTFDLGSQAPGTETPVTFDRAGTVDVICAIHPRMHMTLRITE
jgi:plastocyanin